MLLLNNFNIPKIWKKSRIVPIFKKGRIDDPGNYRPISLTSIPLKVLCHILNQRINEKLVLSKALVGFRRGSSTIDGIFSANLILQEAYSKQKNMHVVSIDLKKAFDSIS